MSVYLTGGRAESAARERHRASLDALRGGRPVTGFMLASSVSLDFVQFLDPVPDFVVIEMEHSQFSWPEVGTCLRLLDVLGVPSFVRIPEIRYEAISKALDSGADGVLVPRIRTVEEFELVVHAMRLPPAGGKGIGGYDFQGVDLAAKLSGYNEEKVLLIQVENRDAVANLPTMLATGQVAGVIIGPFDLSQSLGAPGDFESAEFSATVDTVIAASKAAGVAAGAMLPSPVLASDWLGRGMSIAWIGTEVSLFTAGYTQARADLGERG